MTGAHLKYLSLFFYHLLQKLKCFKKTEKKVLSAFEKTLFRYYFTICVYIYDDWRVQPLKNHSLPCESKAEVKKRMELCYEV
jgi:hypothetical protein